jgi:hypothetical protein
VSRSAGKWVGGFAGPDQLAAAEAQVEGTGSYAEAWVSSLVTVRYPVLNSPSNFIWPPYVSFVITSL